MMKSRRLLMKSIIARVERINALELGTVEWSGVEWVIGTDGWLRNGAVVLYGAQCLMKKTRPREDNGWALLICGEDEMRGLGKGNWRMERRGRG